MKTDRRVNFRYLKNKKSKSHSDHDWELLFYSTSATIAFCDFHVYAYVNGSPVNSIYAESGRPVQLPLIVSSSPYLSRLNIAYSFIM